MDCEKFARMLDDYENLTDGEMSEMENHADMCPKCRRELNFMRSIIDTTKTLPKLNAPDDFLDTLNDRIDEIENKRGVIRHLTHNWQKYSALAASLALVAVIGTNYDTLLERMQGNDDGIIETVAYTTAPDQNSSPAVVAATDEPRNENPNNADNSANDNTPVTDREQPANERAQSTASGSGNSSLPNPTAQARPMSAATAAPAAVSTTAPAPASETAEPEPQSQNTAVAQDATDEPSDNGYEIDTSRESMGYAMVSGGSDGIDTVNKNDGYTIYADGLLIISQDDYRAAMDIIIRYVTGIYNTYYFMNTSSLGEMRSELYNAGISFEDYINATSEEITFRIIVR